MLGLSGEASITGFELALQQRLGAIGLHNFNLLANYTYADSKVKELVNDRERPLTGQSKHIANVALSYENPSFGFSGQVSWHFKGEQLEASGTSNVDDTWEWDYSRLDFSITQEVFGSLSLFVQGYNLTDAPLHFFFNNPITGQRSDVQVEHYGATYQFGMKWSL